MCFVKSANIDVWFENFEACDTFHWTRYKKWFCDRVHVTTGVLMRCAFPMSTAWFMVSHSPQALDWITPIAKLFKVPLLVSMKLHLTKISFETIKRVMKLYLLPRTSEYLWYVPFDWRLNTINSMTTRAVEVRKRQRAGSWRVTTFRRNLT